MVGDTARLIDNGFLVLMKKGAFSLKHRHATEWRLTEFPCDVTHDLPTKDFMRWNPCPRRPKPSHKKQNTVLLGTTSVPPAEPIGTPGRTDSSKNGRHGTPSRTVKPDFSVSRFDGGYTDKLPAGREPMGESQCDGADSAGMGHNQGSPLDPDIPMFLRRKAEGA